MSQRARGQGSWWLGALVAVSEASAQPRRPPQQPAQTPGAQQVVATPPAIARRVSRATVTILLNDRDVGRGTVIAPTGRILTAMRVLLGQREVRVRYPDGRVDRARLVGMDEAWGVGLLEAASGRWPEQIALATSDVRVRDAVSWLPADGQRVSGGLLRRRRSFAGTGAALLRDAWEIDPVPATSAAGSALVDHRSGAVVGLVVPPEDRESSITGPIQAFGAPLSVVRGVVEAAGLPETPWLGMVVEEIQPGSEIVQAVEGGLRVATVHQGGPAAASGLRGGQRGDVITAVNGQPVRSLDELGTLMQGRRVGETLTLRVVRAGSVRDVPLTLEARQVAQPQ